MFELAVAMLCLEMGATTGIFLWTIWPQSRVHEEAQTAA